MKCKLLLLPFWAGLSFYALKASAKEAPLPGTAKPVTAYGFMENKGQITDQFQSPRLDVDFKLNSKKGLTVFIGKGQIHYQWMSAGTNKKGGLNNPVPVQEAKEIGGYRMDVSLIGANIQAPVITEMPQSFYERYFTNTAFEKGSVAHCFRKITYKNIYPNIDWTLYIQEGKGSNAPSFKYDFIVHPGGKVSDIRLQYGGATNLDLQQDGSLRAVTPMGSIDEQAPLSYTQEGKRVGSRFLLKKDVLTFGVDPYQGDLIIDPSVVWSTYFGGLGNDQPSAIATDSMGNTYMAGGTLSLSNIATTGSYQNTYGGTGNGSYIMGDAFLSKFDPQGNLLWSTYYGGSLEDRGLDLTIDKSSGSIYLAGSTKSTTGIATAGAHQTTIGGNYDAFLVKFDTSGQRLWGTYYGGSSGEGSSYTSIGTACDASGNVFLCGETNSNDNISTTGAYQTTKNIASDAFVAKFNSSGVRQWGTYIGGDDIDKAIKMATDSLGNIYIGGTTQSASGLATPSSYQNTYGGSNDGFVAALSSSGAMLWLSYIGGANFDDVAAVNISSNGKLYVAGNTYSTTGIATTGSFQDTLNGDGSLHGDQFLASFQLNGTPDWITYYGGEMDESPTSLYTDANGHIFMNGYTTSSTAIATTNGIQPSLSNNSYDGYLAEFNTLGQRIWATYLGGPDNDIGIGLSGHNTKVYYAGQTNSSTGIATTGSYQQSFGGGDNDAFLLCLNFCDLPANISSIIGDTSTCAGAQYVYHVDSTAGASSYQWSIPGGWTGTSTGSQIILTAGSQSGTLSVSAINSCGNSDTVHLSLTAHPLPQPIISASGASLHTTGIYNSYQWNYQGQPISGATGATYVATNNGYYSVTVTDSNGCAGTSDSINLAVTAINGPSVSANSIGWYPNPATSEIHLLSPVPLQAFIYDMQGRLLGFFQHAKTISLVNMAQGAYMIRITDTKGTTLKTGQFIKSGQ